MLCSGSKKSSDKRLSFHIKDAGKLSEQQNSDRVMVIVLHETAKSNIFLSSSKTTSDGSSNGHSVTE